MPGTRPDPLQRVTIAILALLMCPAACAAGGGLGGHPVCEASAGHTLACPAAPSDRCLVVGDNEVRDALFLYPLEPGGRPDAARRERIELAHARAPAGNVELSDIEALARLASGELLVYGSHSRNRSCERKEKRRRYLGLRLEAEGALPGSIGLVRTQRDADLASAFDSSEQGLLAQVAERVREVEAAADTGSCAESFDLEGAMVVPLARSSTSRNGTRLPDSARTAGSDAAREEVWVGLRRPLLGGYAILLRHDLTAPALRFDAVRLLDLAGEGVRGLAVARGYVWGLSGMGAGVPDATYRLWRFPLSALLAEPPQPGRSPQSHASSAIAVEDVAEAPRYSEGLAFSEAGIIVVSDGKSGNGKCLQESRYALVPWPDVPAPPR